MIKKFVGREEELKALEAAYNKEGATLAIIYGRRRIGKTELIRHFIKGKKAVFFLATKANANGQMQSLAREVGNEIGNQTIAKFGATGWNMLFEAIGAYKGKEKAIIAIDEFPYLLATDNTLPSVFQAGWDQFMSNANVMLILSGSSMGMMESAALNYSAPLYGRSSTIIKLRQLDLRSVAKLMPGARFEEVLCHYFIFGGVPYYYTLINGSDSTEKSVDAIFENSDLFLNEVSVLLSEEVKSDSKYVGVLTAMANGVNKPGELASRLGIFHSNLDRYLSLLERIGLVKKEYPVTENESRMAKGGIYNIADPYTLFWATVLNRYKDPITAKSYAAKVAVISSIKTVLAERRFEDACKEFLVYLSNKHAAFSILKIGSWWGKNPKKAAGQNEEEIDIVALNDDTKEILFAECKWSNSKVGADVYFGLKRKAALVNWHREKRKEYYALFAKAGFTEEMKGIADEDHVMLFDIDAIKKALE